MTKLRKKSEGIRYFILDHVDKHPVDIAKITAEHFQISRQAVNKYLQKLEEEKSLTVNGKTRNITYKLASISEQTFTYEMTSALAEDLVWRKDIRPTLGNMPDNVVEIWQYGFTEIFNNVLDHSDGSTIAVQIKKTAMNIQMLILGWCWDFQKNTNIFKFTG